MNDFKINNRPTSIWSLNFRTGTYQQLVQAPTRKVSPLNMNWLDQDGTEVDRSYNYYESKAVSLPVVISAKSSVELLRFYDSFVKEVLISGNDIQLDSFKLQRRFVLRYQSVSNTIWSETSVIFTIDLVDDYPATLNPIS